MNKPLLILDLDETLIHAAKQPLQHACDFGLFGYHVYKRPHVAAFIRTCAQHFKLAVWSSASDDYVAAIVKEIFPGDIPLEFVWARSRCTPVSTVKIDEYGYYNIDGFSHYAYTKQLIKVRRKGYDLRLVLIVDDTPEKVRNCYGNAIYPSAFTGDLSDKELLWLADYLLRFVSVASVRTIEKRRWQDQYRNHNFAEQ
jgi:RNA polymerase II subunit A small phosphatase-like protein